MAAVDNFVSGRAQQATRSAGHVALVTAADSDLTYVTRGVSFAVAGTLVVNTVGGETGVVIPSGALAAGIIHPLEVTQIKAASTATGIVAYW